MFLPHFLCLIPYHLLPVPTIFKFLSVIRLTKSRKLAHLIDRLQLTPEMRAFLRLLLIVFEFTLLMHIFTCLWHYLVERQKVWIPPNDFIEAGTPFLSVFSQQDHQYLTYLYYSILMFGENEMGPRTNLEIAVIFLIMFSSRFYKDVFFANFVYYN